VFGFRVQGVQGSGFRVEGGGFGVCSVGFDQQRKLHEGEHRAPALGRLDE